MRGGFDVLADLPGALDYAGNEVDPVLQEGVALAPLGVGVNAVGNLIVIYVYDATVASRLLISMQGLAL